MMADNLALS